MSRERELLERALDKWIIGSDEDVQRVMDEIGEFLAEPEQDYELVAWMLKIKDGKGYRLKSFTHIERRDVEIGLEKAKGFADIEIVPLYCRRQRAMSEHDEPFAYINEKEVLYINGLKANNLATEWKSNLGLTKEPKDVGLYLHPAPRKPFVRLSEEEIVSWWGVATEAGLIEFARAIEDALEEKNK